MSATDKEAIEAFQYCCNLEGIIPALEPSHALAVLKKIAKHRKIYELYMLFPNLSLYKLNILLPDFDH